MATINGVPVNFGFQGSLSGGNQGCSLSGVTGLLQSLEESVTADVEKVKDGNGNEVVHSWSNQRKTATLEWVLSGATLAGVTANLVAALKTPGSLVAITACASNTDLVGITWEVQEGAKVSQSNTTAAKVSIPLSYCAGVTAVAS